MKNSILITGGTGIVGTTLIKSLIKDDFHIFSTTRDMKKCENWFKENNVNPNNVTFIEVDFFNKNAVEVLLNQLSNTIFAVIHNARDLESIKLNTKGEISIEQFQNELYLAVTFPYILTNKLIELNRLTNDVIFISSMYGVVAASPSLYDNFKLQSPINYGVAKASQIHLTKEMAVRYSEFNIRVNCISYGGIEGRASDEFKKRYSKFSPLKLMLSKKDLYPPIKMLLDNSSLLITGENIKIDGGWTIW